MKFRTDFVTNSSSSSYVCEICGRIDSGWGMGLYEAGMVECVNGHVLCVEEALARPHKRIMIETILENEYNKHSKEELSAMDDDVLFDEHLTDGGYYGVPECMCPICQFIEYSDNDLGAYLLKKYKVPRDKVFEEVKKFNKRRKKLYENEYITYVCQECELNPVEIVAGWKEQFGSYAAFKKYLREN